MECAPNRRRPDFVFIWKGIVVIVEVDEHAHRHYNRDCELARVTELMEQCEGTPLFLIRFNPKQELLDDLKRVITLAINSVDELVELPLLEVAFIGYDSEFDVIGGIEELAQRRLH